MMTQSVMTQAAQMNAISAGYSGSSKAKTNAGCFSTIMNKSLSTKVSASGQTKEYVSKSTDDKQCSKTADKKDSAGGAAGPDRTKDSSAIADNGSKNVEKVDTSAKDGQQKAGKEDSNQAGTDENGGAVTKNEEASAGKTADSTEKSKKSTGTDGMDASEEDISYENIDLVTLAAQIHEMLKSIREDIAKTLNLTPEEFDQLLKNQGFDETDLTDSDKLKLLLLKSNGKADISDYLTDENLADTLKELLNGVENSKKDSGLNLTGEQIKDIIAKASEKTKEKAAASNDMTEILSKPIEEEALAGSHETAEKQAVKSSGQPISEDTDNTKQTDNQSESLGKVKIEVTKFSQAGETGNQTKEDTNHNASSKSDTAGQLETFISSLTKNVQETGTDSSGEAAKLTQLREIVSQICEKIKILLKPEQTTMELTLNPESLGKVNLTVQSKNGTMTAHFAVQNEMAREAIESQMQTLQQAFDKQGIKVEAIEVTVSGYTFDQRNKSDSDEPSSRQTGQKKGQGLKVTLQDAMAMDEIPQDEGNAADITGVRGSRIDYTA